MQHVTLFEVLIRAEVGVEGLIAPLLRGTPIPCTEEHEHRDHFEASGEGVLRVQALPVPNEPRVAPSLSGVSSVGGPRVGASAQVLEPRDIGPG